MNFKTEKSGDQTIITVMTDRLDVVVAPELKALVSGLAAINENQLLLDFENVSFMDSSGLGAVVSCLKEVSEEGDFVICRLSGVVEELFKLTNMDQVFIIAKGREDGLARFAA